MTGVNAVSLGHRFFSLSATLGVGLFVLGPASATPVNIPAPLVLCAPAPDAVGILRSIGLQSPGSARLRKLLGQTIHLRATSFDYEVAGGGLVGATGIHVLPPGEVRLQGCRLLGATTVVLRDIHTLPGAYIAGLGAAIAYRTTFAWPGNRVDLNDPTMAVYIAAENMAVFVTLVGAAKIPSLECFEEDYRVDIPTLIVRPFDGCVEGHPPNGLLRQNQLPAPNTPR
jgi:hypothetical protein